MWLHGRLLNPGGGVPEPPPHPVRPQYPVQEITKASKCLVGLLERLQYELNCCDDGGYEECDAQHQFPHEFDRLVEIVERLERAGRTALMHAALPLIRHLSCGVPADVLAAFPATARLVHFTFSCFSMKQFVKFTGLLLFSCCVLPGTCRHGFCT